MYDDKKVLITMMFNRLIIALGECTFLITTWFFLFFLAKSLEFTCLKIAVDNN